MRLVVLIALTASAFAVEAPYCFPDTCRVDDNCVDLIHYASPGSAKCCGGHCVLRSRIVSTKLIGESCNEDAFTSVDGITNNYESCGGQCVANLYCSEDRTCHAQKGPGCNCSAAEQCLSGICAYSNRADNYTVCRGSNLANGQNCTLNTECASGLCNNFMCQGLPDNDPCFSDAQCTAPSVCRSSGLGTTCQAPCALDAASCCTSTLDCAGLDGSIPPKIQCFAGTCKNSPLLGEACPGVSCANESHVCLSPCTGTVVGSECSTVDSPSVCQLIRQRALGELCINSIQCPKNSTCAAVGSDPSRKCQPNYMADVGGACGRTSGFSILCKNSSNLCVPDATTANLYTCRERYTLPAYAPCDGFTDLCMVGLTCKRNASFSFVCTPTLPAGSACTTNFNDPNCEGGAYMCVTSTGVYGSCTSLLDNCVCAGLYSVAADQPCSTFTTGQCANGTLCYQKHGSLNPVCVAQKVRKTNEDCTYSGECADIYSECLTDNQNYTCQPVPGKPCQRVDDCDNGYPKYDCGCNRKCAILNPPTPAPAPSPVAPYVNPCQAKRDVLTNEPYIQFNYGTNGIPSTNWYSYTTFASAINALRQLPPRIASEVIDYACCNQCPYTSPSSRFHTPIWNGYQIDCGTRNFTLLNQNACNDKTAQLAVLGCWPASPASTLSFGFALFFTFVAMLF